MKKLSLNLKKGAAKLKVENLDDLWYLSQIIDSGDFISGTTERKLKLGGEGDRAGKNIRKKIFLEIQAEKVELQDNCLRINGKVSQGTDDVPQGSYHTFNIDLDDHTFNLRKTKFLSYQVSKLNQAFNSKGTCIIILVLDRETAIFAISKKQGYEILAEFSGDVAKQDENIKPKGSFYADVETILTDYNIRHKPQHIVVASPAFFKEDFLKVMKSKDLKKKIALATCSSVTSNAIHEVLRRPEVSQVLRDDLISQETKYVTELMSEISKGELAAYGVKAIKTAADIGAIKTLLVTDKKIGMAREENKYAQLDYIMRTVDSNKGEVHLISSTHEGGKMLDGLGGVGAILRFRVA